MEAVGEWALDEGLEGLDRFWAPLWEGPEGTNEVGEVGDYFDQLGVPLVSEKVPQQEAEDLRVAQDVVDVPSILYDDREEACVPEFVDVVGNEVRRKEDQQRTGKPEEAADVHDVRPSVESDATFHRER